MRASNTPESSHIFCHLVSNSAKLYFIIAPASTLLWNFKISIKITDLQAEGKFLGFNTTPRLKHQIIHLRPVMLLTTPQGLDYGRGRNDGMGVMTRLDIPHKGDRKRSPCEASVPGSL
jgi:hypothetical protein